jgi:hypothetical protein
MASNLLVASGVSDPFLLVERVVPAVVRETLRRWRFVFVVLNEINRSLGNGRRGDAALRRVSPGSPLSNGWMGCANLIPYRGHLGPSTVLAYCQHSAGDWRNRI